MFTCVVYSQGLKLGTPSYKAPEALEVKLSKRALPCKPSTSAWLLSHSWREAHGLPQFCYQIPRHVAYPLQSIHNASRKQDLTDRYLES